MTTPLATPQATTRIKRSVTPEPKHVVKADSPVHKRRPPAELSLLSLLRNEVLRYSQVWEDDALLTTGLAVGPDDAVLSIASAGDNVLNILLKGKHRRSSLGLPSHPTLPSQQRSSQDARDRCWIVAEPKAIYCVDVNLAQTALCELKIAAIKQLDHADFLLLLGYTSCSGADQRRRDIFTALELSQGARGIATAGRLEGYFRSFMEKVHESCWPSDGVDRLLSARTIAEQLSVWMELDTPAFEELFHRHFGKETQQKEGRSEQQMAHVEGRITDDLLCRLRRMIGSVLCKDNFYFRRFLDHRAPTACSPYLLEENYGRLRQLVPRVTLRTQSLQDTLGSVAQGFFSKVYVSDIFEYCSLGDAQTLLETFAAAMPAGGRLAYWELYLARPPVQGGAFEVDEASAHTRMYDRNFFYRGFHILSKK